MIQLFRLLAENRRSHRRSRSNRQPFRLRSQWLESRRLLAAGDLDLTFGGGDGIVTTDIGSSMDRGQSVAVDAAGNYLVAGHSWRSGTSTYFTLFRYTPDGALDTSFGGGDGIVTTDIGPDNDHAFSVAVDGNGNYVVAGYTYNGSNRDFALVRYTSAGVLDSTFGGGDGIVTTDLGSRNDYARSVAVDPDGNYVVAGYTTPVTNQDFVLVRYTSTGVPDPTFGDGDGIVTTRIGSFNEQGWSVAVDEAGNYVVAGHSSNNVYFDFALVRYTSTGALDTSFGGGDGIVTTDIGPSDDFARSVAVDAAGNYLVAGQVNVYLGSTNNDFALVRYTSAGVLDTSFGGGDGIVITPPGSLNDGAYSVVVDAAGNYVVAGYSRNDSDSDIALVRYTAAGVLDTSFGGGDGIATTPIGSLNEGSYSVVVDAAGNYLVAGYSQNGSNEDVVLLRYEGGPIGTLSATLTEGNLSITDFDPSGKHNDLSVKLVNGGADLEITAANESFQSAPVGGTLSNDQKTLTITLSFVTSGLTVNGAGGNDTFTIDLSGGSIDWPVTLNGGTGVDTVDINGAVSLTNNDLTVTADTINVNAAITTGGGDLSLNSSSDIIVGDEIATGGGAVILRADSDGDGTGTLSLTKNALAYWDQNKKLTAQDPAPVDQFGWSVAIDGDTAIVGAFRDDAPENASGSVYVFIREGDTWNQQAMLTPNDAAAGDEFGSSVSVSGDTVIVGADHDDDSGINSGSAYVFIRNGSAWTQQAKLTANDGSAGDSFGGEVSISGHTAVVGADGDDDHSTDSGAAYVFIRTGETWSQQAKLTADDADRNDSFGKSVAVSGETVIVGSYHDDDAGDDSGSAYVFVRSGSTWTQQAKLTADDAAEGDIFGLAVSVSGNTALVGSRFDNDAGNHSGSAYVFTRTGTSWTQQAKLTADDATPSDLFGVSVSVNGNTAIIGASADNHLGFLTGSAYVFTRSGTTWTQQSKIIAADAASGDQFGIAVAVSGTAAIVGASLDRDGGTASGSAYMFTSSHGNVISAGSGAVTLKGAEVVLNAAIVTTGTVSISSQQVGRPINLGSNIPGALALTDEELDRITSAALHIGSASSGNVTVSASITRTIPTNIEVSSGGQITFDSGSLHTAGGTLVLDSGSSVNPITSGTDALASSLSFGSGTEVAIPIEGTLADIEHSQLSVVGQLDLTGVDLVLSGSFTPTVNHVFTIVENDGTDPIIGTFNDLAEGATLPNFLGSGLTFAITYIGGTGNDVVLWPAMMPRVSGRRVFYNASAFDGANVAANPADDAAIATDKSALLPGGTATFANYTSYPRGLNGLMVDIYSAAISASISEADFGFRTGNDMELETWSAGPSPSSVTVRDLGGDISRVTLIWPAAAILSEWLEVTVRPTANTGLMSDDLFYFGNAPGDTGDGDPSVDATDFANVRTHPKNFLDPALVDDRQDFNRDRRVDILDLVTIRDQSTTVASALKMISIPPLPAESVALNFIGGRFNDPEVSDADASSNRTDKRVPKANADVSTAAEIDSADVDRLMASLAVAASTPSGSFHGALSAPALSSAELACSTLICSRLGEMLWR